MNVFRKLLIAVAALVAIPGVAAAQACTGPASGVRFFVNVENIRSSNGLVAGRVACAAQESGFLARPGSL